MDHRTTAHLISATTNQPLDYRILVFVEESSASMECLKLLGKMSSPIQTTYHLASIVHVESATLDEPDVWSSSELNLWRQILRNDLDAQQINARLIFERASATLKKLRPSTHSETHVLVGISSDAFQDLLQQIRHDLVLIGCDIDSLLRTVSPREFNRTLSRIFTGPVIVVSDSGIEGDVVVRTEAGRRDVRGLSDLPDRLPTDEGLKSVRTHDDDSVIRTVAESLSRKSCVESLLPGATR